MRYYILMIFILLTSTLVGQSVEKCDSKVLVFTSKKIETLTQKELTDFLLTFGLECRNNVEFSEWSNELLFRILEKQTELTVKTIEREEKKRELQQM